MQELEYTGPMTTTWLIYGANGYTGTLIAEAAVAAGMSPIVAGRSAAAVGDLAQRLGVAARVFDLAAPLAVDRGLEGVSLVLHTAGPFSATSAPMVAGCLRQGVHYLDITGELSVFSALMAQAEAAAERGIVLLPGVGFDVVPSDCLAAALAAALPGATHLELAIQAFTVSRGTLKTMIEQLGHNVPVRRDGHVVDIPPGSQTREVNFSGKPRQATAVGWGDVMTAFHSTKIPNITTFMMMSPAQISQMRILRWFGPLLRSRLVVRALQALVGRTVVGPDAMARETGVAEIWGQVRTTDGRSVEGRVRTPEAYKATAIAALGCVERMLAAPPSPGFHTPASAFGPELLASLPGFTIEVDEPA